MNNLEACGIDYMLTGSFASNIHGVPRTTYDANVVIEVGARNVDEFVRSLGDEFYVSLEAAREAVSARKTYPPRETVWNSSFLARSISRG